MPDVSHGNDWLEFILSSSSNHSYDKEHCSFYVDSVTLLPNFLLKDKHDYINMHDSHGLLAKLDVSV